MRKLLLIPLLLAVPSILTAQRMGFRHFPGHVADFNRPGYPGAVYYPVPLYDPFDSGYVSDAVYQAPSQPVVLMMQPEPTPAAPEPVAPSPPLMIELQGDRYVQISGDAVSTSQTIDQPAAGPAAQPRITTTPQPKLTSTILVFRDGHQQEVSAYTIADGTLYAATDYYTSGAWNQEIALTSLFLPETIAANRQRGVQFRLPTSPNEVIVGP